MGLKFLVRDGCIGCDDVKAMLAEEIASGEVGLVDFKSPEGQRVSQALGVNEVPTPFLEEGDKLTKCALRTDGDDLLVECPDERPPT